MNRLKPLDFVKTPSGNIAIVTEVNAVNYDQTKQQASITFIGEQLPGTNDYNSWWAEEDLQIIDSLPRILSMCMKHPFGNGKEKVDEYFPAPEKPVKIRENNKRIS